MYTRIFYIDLLLHLDKVQLAKYGNWKPLAIQLDTSNSWSDSPLLICYPQVTLIIADLALYVNKKKLHKNKPPILGILYNSLLAALVDVCGANYARAIETQGSKEKARQRPSTGLYLYFCFMFLSSFLSSSSQRLFTGFSAHRHIV